MNTMGKKNVSGTRYSHPWGGARNFAVVLLLSGIFFPGLAFGQWSRNDLNSKASSGGTVTVPAAGVNFINDYSSANAVEIKKNTVLRGSVYNRFPTSIGSLTAAILDQINAQKTGETGSLVSLISGQVNAFGVPGNLSFIQGSGGGNRSTSTGDLTQFDITKWLEIAKGTNLGLEYLHFRNVAIENTFSSSSAGGMTNGLIGNVSGNTSDIAMGNVTGNAFTGIKVTLHGHRDSHYLAGGGVIGLRATGEGDGTQSASASMKDITGNVFRDVTVVTDKSSNDSATGSAYIEGGGIIGVDAVSSPSVKPGHASIRSLTNNLFTGIKVRSDDIILGGGLIGVNNNSQNNDPNTTYSEILAVSGNIFGNGKLDKNDPKDTADITVLSRYSLRGGGVIGVNGLSNAAVRLDGLAKNVFAGIYVDTDSYLKGGGIIGVQSNDGGLSDSGEGKIASNIDGMAAVSAYLGDVRENLFFNQRVDVGTYLSGGGIIGVRSNQGLVALGGLQDNIFKGLTVNVEDTEETNYLDGGGIVGASAAAEAAITDVRNNYLDDLVVNAGSNLLGGGVLGASSSNGPASVGALGVAEVDNVIGNAFSNITVTVGGKLSGGGIVGANSAVKDIPSANYYALIPTLTGNTFSNIVVLTTGNILGGGVVGAHTDYQSNGDYVGTTGSTNFSNNRFTGIQISSSMGNIQGGGIVGFDAAGETSAYMGTVSGNDFSNSSVTAKNITGGGVLGVYSNDGIAWIERVTDSTFYGLRITASGYIDGGGLVGATGSTHAKTGQFIGIGLIDKSVFANNTVTAANGQIMAGAVYSYGSFLGMTIRDSAFFDNVFSSTCTSCGSSAPGKVYGTVVVDTGLAGPGADEYPNTLTLTATAGNTTWFKNNQIIENSGTPSTNSLYFGTILDAASSYATDTAQSDAELIISPEKGGTVALYDPIVVNQDNASESDRKFAMTVQGAGEFLWGGENVFNVGDSYSSSYAVDNTVLFKSGSTTTLLSGMTLTAEAHDVTLEAGGRINVMGGNELTVNTATLYGHLHFNLNASTVNNLDTALLTITSDSAADISNATVSLSNFTAGEPLKAGDEFYLIETKDNEDLDNEPANNTAYARQGMTRAYNFIVDKESGEENVENRRLVARLVDAPFPAKETRILAEGRIAGLSLLGQNANWLADHSYHQADLALRRGENRAFFGGADFASVRIDTGSTVDYKGYTLVAGEAVKREKEDQSLLFGGFFEAGYGDYDVHGKFGHPDHPRMKGNGTLYYYGIGLMLRQRWDNGFRLEGSLRGGRQENKFRSRDLDDADGEIAKYKLNVPWFGAHVGAGHEWQADEHNGFDAYLRYYWVRQNGKTVHLNKDRESVRFLADNSHRARAGGRYTRTKDVHNAWYLGLAYEYEFDHRTHARSADGKIDMPDPRGGSGIGEIGMILHPKDHDRLSIEFGLQGYAGKRKGVSGGARLGWKF
ncbi:MAG: autotransporter outer membrane beta-barrel domain-containing protein [Azoarcus sp.]|jgi:hypothetical protein|nr:autotransporter outer membrane beta-barrel domain-containing protein [Azoarcus sp.]